MATPKASGKVLRIGIVQGDQIVQEQLIRRPENVTVGESTKNTFVLPPCSLPKRFPLFVAKGNSYFLQFTDGMAGKISFKGRIQSLDDLKTSGEAVRRGGTWVLPVQESSRGKVIIDGISVLFQFVPAPPQAIARSIQMDFRPRFIEDDDPVFFGFLALFAALATSLAIYAHSADYSQQDSYQDAARIAKLLNAEPPEEKPDPPEEKTEPVKDTEKSTDGTKQEKPEEVKQEVKQEKPKTKAEKQAEDDRKEVIAEEKATARAASIFGTTSDSSGTTVAPVEDNVDWGDVDKDTEVDTTGGGARDGSGGKRETVKKDGPGKSEVGTSTTKEREAVVKGTMKTGKETVEVEEGEAGGVTAVIKAKKGRIKQCYDMELRNSPKLEGKVTVYFEVGRGRVLEAEIQGNSTRNDALAKCILVKIKKLRFPDGVEATVEYPFIFSSQD